MKRLSRSFFNRPSDVVAQELIGKLLSHKTGKGVASGIIVETEAYFGFNDPASHAARKKTPRNEVMFGSPGVAYVYFCYGTHYLFNVVTEKKGIAGAVLIRALEPYQGEDLMRARRKGDKSLQWTNGPGKLTEALSIGKNQNKQDLLSGDLAVYDLKIAPEKIKKSGRIGIQNGTELLLRYYWAGNKYVSAKPKD